MEPGVVATVHEAVGSITTIFLNNAEPFFVDDKMAQELRKALCLEVADLVKVVSKTWQGRNNLWKRLVTL